MKGKNGLRTKRSATKQTTAIPRRSPMKNKHNELVHIQASVFTGLELQLGVPRERKVHPRILENLAVHTSETLLCERIIAKDRLNRQRHKARYV